MQAIEYKTIDRSKWPKGPWDDEPDKRQWQDAATGFPCLIVRVGSMGHLCGYVGVPRGHPYHGVHYNEVDVDGIHGGLTFSSACDGDEEVGVCHKVEENEPGDVWWLGFDCGHYHDVSPGIMVRSQSTLQYSHAEYRNFDFVRRQIERLAKQLFTEVSHD